MRALIYHGRHDVRLETVPDPVLQQDDDIILRVTATAICGSDLNFYRGNIPEAKTGAILGHEFMGVVEDAGHGVSKLKRGDRVIIPFSANESMAEGLADGTTRPARLRTGSELPSARKQSRIQGGHAEYARVDRANVSPFKVNSSLSDEQLLFLTDILPTAYQAALHARVVSGSRVVIFGAGPVGLMAAACARMMGAETIFMVDRHASGLDFASEKYNTVSINYQQEDPAGVIRSNTLYRGADAVIDAIGFESRNSHVDRLIDHLKPDGQSGKALRQCIASVSAGGIISMPAVYSGLVDDLLFEGSCGKDLSFKMEQTHAHRYLPELLEHIENGDLSPADIITHRMSLEHAVQGYEILDKQQEQCRKVVMRPGLH